MRQQELTRADKPGLRPVELDELELSPAELESLRRAAVGVDEFDDPGDLPEDTIELVLRRYGEPGEDPWDVIARVAGDNHDYWDYLMSMLLTRDGRRDFVAGGGERYDHRGFARFQRREWRAWSRRMDRLEGRRRIGSHTRVRSRSPRRVRRTRGPRRPRAPASRSGDSGDAEQPLAVEAVP